MVAALPVCGCIGERGTKRNKGWGRLATGATEVKASMARSEREKEEATG